MTQSQHDQKERCCYIYDGSKEQCILNAEYMILTLRRGGKFAGPDPYTDEHYTCEHHVGSLLGYQPEAEHPEEIYWEVEYYATS